MPVNKLFGGSFTLLEQAMNLRAQRQGIIESNIANMETPGYRAQDIEFKKIMQSLMTKEGAMATTHPDHIDNTVSKNSGQHGSIREKGPVDLDEEMINLAQNQLLYEITTDIISRKFNGMKFIIDEGGK